MAEDLTRFAGPIAGNGTNQALYTVPGSKKASIRSIRIVNNHASAAAACKMSIGADGGSTRIIPLGYEVPAKGIYQDDSLHVLNATDVLNWTGTADLTVTVYGVLVDA